MCRCRTSLIGGTKKGHGKISWPNPIEVLQQNLGQSGRRKFQPPRQLMTQLRHQCVNIAVTRNTGPLTKND
jgi:hypothetical protein